MTDAATIAFQKKCPHAFIPYKPHDICVKCGVSADKWDEMLKEIEREAMSTDYGNDIMGGHCW